MKVLGKSGGKTEWSSKKALFEAYGLCQCRLMRKLYEKLIWKLKKCSFISFRNAGWKRDGSHLKRFLKSSLDGSFACSFHSWFESFSKSSFTSLRTAWEGWEKIFGRFLEKPGNSGEKLIWKLLASFSKNFTPTLCGFMWKLCQSSFESFVKRKGREKLRQSPEKARSKASEKSQNNSHSKLSRKLAKRSTKGRRLFPHKFDSRIMKTILWTFIEYILKLQLKLLWRNSRTNRKKNLFLIFHLFFQPKMINKRKKFFISSNSILFCDESWLFIWNFAWMWAWRRHISARENFLPDEKAKSEKKHVRSGQTEETGNERFVNDGSVNF